MAVLMIEEGKKPTGYMPEPTKNLDSIMEETIEATKEQLLDFDYESAKQTIDSYRWNYSHNHRIDEYASNPRIQLMNNHIKILWAKANLGIVDEYKNEILTNPEQCSGELTDLCTQAALKIDDIQRTVDIVNKYLVKIEPANVEDEFYLRKLRIENNNLNARVNKNQEIYNNILPYVAGKISKHKQEQQTPIKYH